MTEDAQDKWPEWTAWVKRWTALIEGLRGRPGLDDAKLEEIEFHGCQEPFLGISALLCGHELGDFDLTAAEEDELWDLAAEDELTDDDIMSRWVIERSVRDRPVRRVRSKRPLRGGGHGPGRRMPGKREFPSRWSDDDVVAHTMDVARHPSGAVELPSGDFRAWGERDGVQLSVLVSPQGDVLTSYPVEGDGVVQHPLSPEQEPHVQRLQELVDAAPVEAVRADLEELMAVGEWPHVIASLRALDLSDEQRARLDALPS